MSAFLLVVFADGFNKSGFVFHDATGPFRHFRVLTLPNFFGHLVDQSEVVTHL